MHRIALLAALTCFVLTSASAQIWFDIGVKGAWGPTSALNKNISDEGRYTYNVVTGTAFGGKIGVNWGAYHGVAIEGLAATNNANYDYQLSGNQLINDLKWKTTDLMLLYRYQGQGAYFEIGPKYSIMNEIDQNDGPEEMNNIDKSNFENYLSGVIGFGSYLAGTGSLQIILGIRLHYALQDMVSEEGFETLNLPTPNYPDFPTQQKTSPIAAQLSLEINYVLGYVGKQFCYDRWRLMSFD